MAVPNPLLDGEADEEERDDLHKADRRVNRVPRERARLRPAGVTRVEAGAGDDAPARQELPRLSPGALVGRPGFAK